VRERKSKLNIKSVAVDSMLIKRKDAIKHSAIASKKRPRTSRLLSNFITVRSPSSSTVRFYKKYDIKLNFSFKIFGISVVAKRKPKSSKIAKFTLGIHF